MTPEQRQALVADVVSVLRRHAQEIDEGARFPSEGLQALRDSGLLGLLVPTEYGGLGAGLDTMVEVTSELAAGCLSTALVWVMHCQQVDAMARYGSKELRAEVLPLVAAGRHYIASVTTEPAKGGHLLTAQASLQPDGEHLCIERDAPVVTGGAHADGYLVTMRADAEAAPHEVSLVYAARQQLDIEVTGEWNSLGMRGTSSLGLRLSGRVPRTQIVGEPGQFREVALESLIPLAHLGWSACWLGGVRGLLQEVLDAVRSRTWRLDTASELVRERLARIRIDLELVSGYLHRVCAEVTAARHDERSLSGPKEQIHLNTLKVAAAELTFRAADRIMQLGGLSRGYARTSALPIERVFRDLRSASLNYSDDRLLTAIGSLLPLDRSVGLA
jgi:acyl-CoA dehydrogenase